MCKIKPFNSAFSLVSRNFHLWQVLGEGDAASLQGQVIPASLGRFPLAYEARKMSNWEGEEEWPQMHSLHYSGRKSIYFIQLLVTAFLCWSHTQLCNWSQFLHTLAGPSHWVQEPGLTRWCAVQINRVLSKNFLLFCKFAKSFT